MYSQIKAESRAVGESNDCSVIATSIITGVEYRKCLDLFSAMGRASRRGTAHQITQDVLKLLGVEYRVFNPNIDGYHKFTPRTIGSHYSIGKYMFYSRSHMLAVVDGKVHDWSEGRCHRIIGGYAIISINGKCAITGKEIVKCI